MMRLIRTILNWLLDDPYSLRSLPHVMVPELQAIREHLDAQQAAIQRPKS
jgi:hypothetical protein